MSCFVPSLCFFRMCITAAASEPYFLSQWKHLKSLVISEAVRRTFLCWRFWSQSAIRKGKWKYYRAGKKEFLFDLDSKAHEHRNLIKEHPKIAAELYGKLETWCAGMKNPGFPAMGMNAAERKYVEHYLPK